MRWKFPFTFSLKKFYLLEPHLACDQVPARLDDEPVWNPSISMLNAVSLVRRHS